MDDFEYDENLAREGWIERGEARGLAIGEARGEARGKAIGEIQGALRREIEIAKKLMDMNMSIELIVEATGLSETEILKLAKE